MLSGLCGGLGELTNTDATLFRILLVVLMIISSGSFIFVYIIVSLVVPKSPHYPNSFHQNRPPNMNGFDQRNQSNHHNGFDNRNHMNQQNGFGDPFQTKHNHSPNSTPPPWESDMNQGNSNQANGSDLDKMMDDLEKKALKREIEELKNKLSKMEKGE